jgi:putative membrane protein
MDFRGTTHKPEIWKGAVAGAVGGLIASWVMNQFQTSSARQAASQKQSRSPNVSKQQKENGEDATVKAAELVVENVAGRPLRETQKPKAGALVHYAFGTALGVLYGAAAEMIPQIASVWGLPYGAAVFVGADEIAVPALGLSKPPTEYPASKHAYALASHLVYGATLETVRRVIREKVM